MQGGQELNREEELQIENDFLKLKLMIEKGAQFISGNGTEKLPPKIENEFLRYIQEFERQAESNKKIKIIDKIGKPVFRPPADIHELEMAKAWEELSDYLLSHSISLDVCSPNIKPAEMYRFAVEELFEMEIDDINIPGMVHGFIYDEFYPDLVYDNKMSAEEFMFRILETGPLQGMLLFREESLKLNDWFPLTQSQFIERINHFKQAYDDILVTEMRVIDSSLDDLTGVVKGFYQAVGIIGKYEYKMEGEWKVLFEKDKDIGYSVITGLEMEGIKF